MESIRSWKQNATSEYVELHDRLDDNSPFSPPGYEAYPPWQRETMGQVPVINTGYTAHAQNTYGAPAQNTYGVPPHHKADKPLYVSFWNALLHYATHLLPILITVTIFIFSFKNVYWTDIGTPHLNSILNGLQFGAKFHELTMQASITALVLHRLRFELIEMGGVSLGIATSGYRLDDVSFLISSEFWAGILGYRKRDNKKWLPQRWLPLSLLLPISFLLTSTVGPSSAIVMIPQLDWWDLKDPFNKSTLTAYVNLKDTPEATWPTSITGAFLPKGCDDSVGKYCPSAGLPTIERWISDFQNNNILPNFTVPNDGEVERYLSSTKVNKKESNNQALDPGFTISSTVHARAARDLGAFWEYAIGDPNTTYSLIHTAARPMIIPSSDVGIKKPVVQVQCQLYKNITDTSTMSFPHDLINTSPANRYNGGDWSIPAFDVLAEAKNELSFRWVDMQKYTGRPTIGAIFVGLGSGVSEDGESHPPVVVPCTIDASWASVKMWLDPRVNSVILQDSPDPSELVVDQKSIDALEPISIDMEWAEALNIVQLKTNDTDPLPGPIGNFTTIERLISGFGYDDKGWILNSVGSVEWCCSTSLGLYLSDALARVQSNISSAMYHQFPAPSGGSQVTILNNIFGGTEGAIGFNASQTTWDKFITAQGNWTANTYQVQRYGYGWGYRDIPTLLAMAVLVFQGLLSTAHLISFAFSSWRCWNWDTMGEMLALALKSKAADELKGSSAGVERFSTWKLNTKVLQIGAKEFEMKVD